VRNKSKFAALGIIALILAMGVVFLASIAPFANAAAPRSVAVASTTLADTNWMLSSLDGRLLFPGSRITLRFDKDGSATGTDGCNQFRTTYTQQDSSLTFKKPAASSLLACPEPIMTQAATYMTALGKTTAFMASGGVLILLGDDEILATFVTESQELKDTAWDVINLNNGRGAVVGLLPETEITALFGADGTVTGNAGCNEYFAEYAVLSDTIKIGTPGTTFRFCAEPKGVMDQEFEFLNALASAATYSINGDMLQMRTADDQLALIMVRKPIVDLPAPQPTPLTPIGRVTGTQVLNIRSGPGTNFPVVGQARYGDEGEIVGRSENSDWWAISIPSLPGGIGWVSADFVLATNAGNVPVIAAPQLPPTPTPIPINPTPTPMPQATATPPAKITFGADRTSINRGECVTLNWSVQNVQAVWVYPVGEPYNRFPRKGQGSEKVCPAVTTTYEMRVLLRDGSIQFRQITINVTQPIAPPQPPTIVVPTAVPPTAVPPTAVPTQPIAPPQPPIVDPLAGTRWKVVNLNNGKDAVVGVIAGTTITLEFDTTGRVSGNAGCNTFSASYRVSGNALTIEPPAATAKTCETPEGVMQQEQQYLAALQNAAIFEISNNTLIIRGTDGAMQVVANAKN
jgi:heat shock protein HslJ